VSHLFAYDKYKPYDFCHKINKIKLMMHVPKSMAQAAMFSDYNYVNQDY
jgi:hypothetical protein